MAKRLEDVNDIVGTKFGLLTVKKFLRRDNHSRIYYLCECDCGNMREVRREGLLNGHHVSCGCKKRIKDTDDLVGQTFSELTVLEYLGKEGRNHKYRCRCSCGQECIAERVSLIRGNKKSCGHLRRSQKPKIKEKRPKIPKYDVSDIIGQKFGKWEVLEYAGRMYGLSFRGYRCRCECGNESVIPRDCLLRGLSKSCGHCIEPWIEKMDGYYRYHCVTGTTFLFSPEDYDLVNSRKWTMNLDGYAVTTDTQERLIRLIMNAKEDEYVDHISMDTTDNRRENLRICSWSDNNCNKVLQSNNISGYKGVSYHRASGKYMACLWKDKIHHYGGLHATPEEAARAYDDLAREYHGEYARLNFPQEGERGCRAAV